MRLTLILLMACAALAQSPEEIEGQLTSVRRIYVEKLTGGEAAAQMRDMLMSALQSSKTFVVTENLDRADAVMRGSAEDLIFTDSFQSGERVDARASFSGRTGSGSSTRAGSTGLGVGLDESTKILERKHEAMASVRLVNREGDVIWSATEESFGGKFKGASADVAEKVVRKLLGDYDRLKKPTVPRP
jgi:hypothetical protein